MEVLPVDKPLPVYACIIARGGSRRIPRKNVQPFCGLPLVEWTLLQAATARWIDRSYLVTDDDEIAGLGRKYGAEIIMQTHEECEHGVYGGGIACMRFLERMVALGRTEAVYCNLLPTSPLRRPGELDAVLRMYFEKCLPLREGLACCARIPHPGILYETSPGRALTLVNATASGYLTYSMAVGICYMPPALASYEGDYSVERLIYNSTHPPKVPSLAPPQQYYPIEHWQAHDIDDWYEFWIAETAMERMILKGRGPAVYSEMEDA